MPVETDCVLEVKKKWGFIQKLRPPPEKKNSKKFKKAAEQKNSELCQITSIEGRGENPSKTSLWKRLTHKGSAEATHRWVWAPVVVIISTPPSIPLPPHFLLHLRHQCLRIQWINRWGELTRPFWPTQRYPKQFFDVFVIKFVSVQGETIQTSLLSAKVFS